MSNYIIWTCKIEGMFLIEIPHKEDLPNIQKYFLESGYIILSIDYAFNEVFMRVERYEQD